MQGDTAWYSWIAEPTFSEEGKPQLRMNDEPDGDQLDRKTFKEIIDRVNSWYDAAFPSLVVNGPGRRTKQ
jgi:hypothetical protein